MDSWNNFVVVVVGNVEEGLVVLGGWVDMKRMVGFEGGDMAEGAREPTFGEVRIQVVVGIVVRMYSVEDMCDRKQVAVVGVVGTKRQGVVRAEHFFGADNQNSAAVVACWSFGYFEDNESRTVGDRALPGARRAVDSHFDLSALEGIPLLDLVGSSLEV